MLAIWYNENSFLKTHNFSEFVYTKFCWYIANIITVPCNLHFFKMRHKDNTCLFLCYIATPHENEHAIYQLSIHQMLFIKKSICYFYTHIIIVNQINPLTKTATLLLFISSLVVESPVKYVFFTGDSTRS